MDAEALLALILKLQLAGSLASPLEATSLAAILKDQLPDAVRPKVALPLIDSILNLHPPDPLFTSPEAALYLGISENTLSVWRCVGRYNIEYIKVGRLVRYRKSALDAFLQRRTRGQVEGL